MDRRLFTNNAYGTLTELIGTTNTLLRVGGDFVDNFPVPLPTEHVRITVQSGVKIEIMQLVSRDAGEFTVVRAQEGTTANSFSVGALVELRVTANSLSAFAQRDVAEGISKEWEFFDQAKVPLTPIDDQHAASKYYVDNKATSAAHVIYDEEDQLPNRANLKFQGAGVTATDDTDGTIVSIPGGGSVAHDRASWTTSAGVSSFQFDAPDEDAVLIFLNGVVLTSVADYTLTAIGGVVSGVVLNEPLESNFDLLVAFY